jgi:acetyl-CoA C-acetyltransferase
MNKNKIPVLVGIAQLVRREKTVAQLDPLQMMAEASQAAVRDATLGDLAKVDTLYMVNCLSKNLSEPVRDLSNLLGIRPVETGYTGIGATAPQWFVNRAAERIFSGKSEMVLICGAEAFYTH